MGTVAPRSAGGPNFSLWEKFGLVEGPMWQITCGKCDLTFKARLPMVNAPSVKCPHCDTINTLSSLELEV